MSTVNKILMPPLPSIDLFKKKQKIVPENNDIITNTKELKIGRSLDTQKLQKINITQKDKDTIAINLKKNTKNDIIQDSVHKTISNAQLLDLKSGTSVNTIDKRGNENTILPKELIKQIHEGKVGDKFTVKNEDSKIYTFYKTQNMQSIKQGALISAQLINTDGKMRFATIPPKPTQLLAPLALKEINKSAPAIQAQIKNQTPPIDAKMNQLENDMPMKNKSIHTTGGKEFKKISFDLYQNENLYAKVNDGNIVFRGFRI